jgi:hypothetical protein
MVSSLGGLRLGFSNETLGVFDEKEKEKKTSCLGGLVRMIHAHWSSLVELGFLLFFPS